MVWIKQTLIFSVVVMCFVLISLHSFTLAEGELSTDTAISSVAWSPNGTLLAAGDYEGFVRIWNAETTSILYEFEAGTQAVYAVTWNPDGDQVAAGNYDGSIHIWDVKNGELLHALQPYRPEIFALTWTPDGSKIIAGTPEVITLHVWDSETGKLLGDYRSGGTIDISWTSDGTRMATANPGGSAQILDGTTFELLERFSIPGSVVGGQGRDVYITQWDPTDTLVAIGSLNGVVRIWNPSSDRILHEFAGHDNPSADSFRSAIRSLRFSDDGLELTSVSADGTIRTWDISTGQRIFDMNVGEYISAAAWNPDGTQLAYGVRASQDTLEGGLRIMSLSIGQAG